MHYAYVHVHVHVHVHKCARDTTFIVINKTLTVIYRMVHNIPMPLCKQKPICIWTPDSCLNEIMYFLVQSK